MTKIEVIICKAMMFKEHWIYDSKQVLGEIYWLLFWVWDEKDSSLEGMIGLNVSWGCLNASNCFLVELWNDFSLSSVSTSVSWEVEMISKLTSRYLRFWFCLVDWN